jgi:diguanylate cyclase (GGDEF)-like protein
MSWVSKFSAGSLEREYQVELGPEKIRLTRIMAVLGITLTLAYMVLDLWAIPSALLTVWALRGAIIAGLALTFLSTNLRSFQALYPYVIIAAATVMGVGVNGMIYVAERTEVAIDAYQGGLILIIMGVYTLSYLNLYVSTAIAVALMVSYAAIAVLVHDYYRGPQLIMLVGHLFLFVSITVIGIAAQVLRDSYSRENYLLRHSLQRDVEIKEEEKRRVSYLAEHDPLTGVANRLRFDKDANALLAHARETRAMVQILFLDLDGFKPVNDAHGHAVGDRVLKVVAERLRQSVQPHDLVARVGGDEFVVALLTPREDRTLGVTAAERIAAAIAEGIELRGATLRLSVSIGVAGYPADGDDLETVLRAADAQMYVVKNRGRSGIALTPGCRPARLAG